MRPLFHNYYFSKHAIIDDGWNIIKISPFKLTLNFIFFLFLSTWNSSAKQSDSCWNWKTVRMPKNSRFQIWLSCNPRWRFWIRMLGNTRCLPGEVVISLAHMSEPWVLKYMPNMFHFHINDFDYCVLIASRFPRVLPAPTMRSQEQQKVIFPIVAYDIMIIIYFMLKDLFLFLVETL